MEPLLCRTATGTALFVQKPENVQIIQLDRNNNAENVRADRATIEEEWLLFQNLPSTRASNLVAERSTG